MMRRHAFTFLFGATLLVAMATFGGCDEYALTEAGLHNSYATPIPDYVPPADTLIHPPATTTTAPAPAVTTAPVIHVDQVPDTVRCPEWWQLVTTFWPEQLWEQADRVIWAETRCQNLHRSTTGTIGYGDHGLFQINAINLDYLSTWGVNADDLMNPAQNVVAALIIYNYANGAYGCGWQPWYSSVDPWAMCDAVQHNG